MREKDRGVRENGEMSYFKTIRNLSTICFSKAMLRRRGCFVKNQNHIIGMLNAGNGSGTTLSHSGNVKHI
jgi:hypothetical protein